MPIAPPSVRAYRRHMSNRTPPRRSPQGWTAATKGVLKAELKLRNMTYADLVQGLAEIGIRETEANLRNKISRGRFSAAFFFQCLAAIGVRTVNVPSAAADEDR